MLQKELGVDTQLEVGAPGSFVVLVDDRVVAEKKGMTFPTDDQVLAAVRSQLGSSRTG